MVDKKTVLKILKMHYIEQKKFTEIANSPNIHYTRQTVAKVCNHYKSVVPEYLRSYYSKDLNKFYSKHKYKRDGSRNVKFDDDDKKKIVRDIAFFTSGELKPNSTSGIVGYRLSSVIRFLRQNGYSYVSESTLRRFIRKKFRYYHKKPKSKTQSEQNDSEPTE